MIAQNDTTLLEFFVKNTPLRGKILIIVFMDDGYYFEGLEILQEIGIMKKSEEGQYPDDLVNRNILIFDQPDLDTAIDLCNRVPDGAPYCQLWQNGIVVHENT